MDWLIVALLVLNLAVGVWRLRVPETLIVPVPPEPAEPVVVEPEALMPATVLATPTQEIPPDPRPLDCGHWATSWATSPRTLWRTGHARTACRRCHEAILHEYGSREF